MLVDSPGTEIRANPAERGLIELVVKLGRHGTYRSIFLTQSQVNELIIQLSAAKKANNDK